MIRAFLLLVLIACERDRAPMSEPQPHGLVRIWTESAPSLPSSRFRGPELRSSGEDLIPQQMVSVVRDCLNSRWRVGGVPLPANVDQFKARQYHISGRWNDLAVPPDVGMLEFFVPADRDLTLTGIYADEPCQDGRILVIVNMGPPP